MAFARARYAHSLVLTAGLAWIGATGVEILPAVAQDHSEAWMYLAQSQREAQGQPRGDGRSGRAPQVRPPTAAMPPKMPATPAPSRPTADQPARPTPKVTVQEGRTKSTDGTPDRSRRSAPSSPSTEAPATAKPATKPGQPMAPAPASGTSTQGAPTLGQGQPTPSSSPPQAAPRGRVEGQPPSAAPTPPQASGGQVTGRELTPSTQPSNLEDLRRGRRQLTEDGGKRTIVIEPGGRRIIRENNRVVIDHDEMLRFQRTGQNVRREQRRDGATVFILARPGRVEIVSVMDRDGRLLRRYRRYTDGREVILIDNSDYWRRHRPGSYVVPVVALGPLVLAIPRRDYIVEYHDASDDRIYEILSAPPVERLERLYSLEEIRYNHALRERMRRIDIDVLNFDSGSWTVNPAQLPRLERMAKVMRRLIERRPDEIFLIEGHTDAVGAPEDNLTLSDRRAEQVAIVLTDQFGVPPENMVTQGYGESFLKIQTSAPEPANRRVAVRRITPLMARR